MVLNLHALLPELTLLSCALAMLLLDLFVPERHKNGVFAFASSVVLGTVLLLVAKQGFNLEPVFAFNGFLKKDAMVNITQGFVVLCGLMAVLLSYSYISKFSLKYRGEYYYTLLFAVFGALLLVASAEFSTLFVSLEVMSISIYILIALFKEEVREAESAVKYFITGSVGSAVLVYGLAILYGVAGSTEYAGVASALRSAGVSAPVLVAMILVAAGFLFKTSTVPFHAWIPDVYHGAPTPVTAFMGAVVKMASFVAFLRLFLPVFYYYTPGEFAPVLLILAVVTMFFGAFMALNQENLKRLLAYSAVSHTGVILTAFAVEPVSGSFALVFYLLVYAFMVVSAFAMVSIMTAEGFKGENLEDWKGLYSKSPFIAVCAVVVFMSLAGIPPFAGFWAKLYILMALVKDGFLTTAFAVVLSTLVSLYFYLKPVVYMFMKEGKGVYPSFTLPGYAVVAVTTLFVIFFGIFPSYLAKLSLAGATAFVRGLI